MNIRCIICDANDKWENVDQYRLDKTRAENGKSVPVNMCICTECGFVTYPSRWKSNDEIKKFYQAEYRQPPRSANLFAGQRKIHYHNHFLNDVILNWREKGKKPVIVEDGAAFGMVLDWFKKVVPGCEVHGTEWTTSFKRNARMEYGIDLTDEIDFTKKYDLVMSYKVLEHQLDADLHLRKLTEALSDEGLLYIGVPQWFNIAHNFGEPGFDPRTYYHQNHVNVWTRKHFEGLLAKCGLEVIKYNHTMYDSVYLCRRNDQVMSLLRAVEKPEEIKEMMSKMKLAWELYSANDFDGAIKVWPNYPTAHSARYEANRKLCHEKGYDWAIENFVEPAIRQCPESVEPFLLAADVSLRFKKYQESISYSEMALKFRPEFVHSYMHLVQTFREMAIHAADEEARIHYLNEARKVIHHVRMVSVEMLAQTYDLMYRFNADIPVEKVQFEHAPQA